MSKNSTRIREAIRRLAQLSYEIRSGTVVPGSVDTTSNTVSVLPSGGGQAIKGVLLNSTESNGNGVIAIPADNSDVVIGTIDGPGEWVVLKTGTIVKVLVKIGNVSCTADHSKVVIQNGAVLLNVGSATFKLNTGGESLYDLLHDLIHTIHDLTSGGYAVDITGQHALETLLVRLSALLSN